MLKIKAQHQQKHVRYAGICSNLAAPVTLLLSSLIIAAAAVNAAAVAVDAAAPQSRSQYEDCNTQLLSGLSGLMGH